MLAIGATDEWRRAHQAVIAGIPAVYCYPGQLLCGVYTTALTITRVAVTCPGES